METLRWMLGHTDIQHLYRYITESETGRVLNGIKASYIVDELETTASRYTGIIKYWKNVMVF